MLDDDGVVEATLEIEELVVCLLEEGDAGEVGAALEAEEVIATVELTLDDGRLVGYTTVSGVPLVEPTSELVLSADLLLLLLLTAELEVATLLVECVTGDATLSELELGVEYVDDEAMLLVVGMLEELELAYVECAEVLLVACAEDELGLEYVDGAAVLLGVLLVESTLEVVGV